MTLQAQAEAVRLGVSSRSTCSPTTVALLNNLLNTKPQAIEVKKGPRVRSAKATRPRAGTLKVPSKASKPPEVSVLEIPDAQPTTLSARERFCLATEVVNATLKVLTEAIKSPLQPKRLSEGGQSAQKSTPGRNIVPHSASSTQQPLQPRSHNQIAHPPAKSPGPSRTSSSSVIASSGLLAIAECARLGFSHLRFLQATKAAGMEIPPLQLENGMSALVGKLIALGFEELAVKEIKILRRRLETYTGEGNYEQEGVVKEGWKATELEREALSSYLRFENINTGEATLTLIVATQMQIVKLIALSKRPANIEAALVHLSLNSPYAPANLILKLSGKTSSATKAAHQLEVLSQTVLSLCPSISVSEDTLAMNPKISVSPPSAFRLQHLAFEARLIWWRLSDHRGDLGREILDPLGRCFGVFARRSTLASEEKYRIALTLFNNIALRLENDGRPFKSSGVPPDTSKLPLFNIYKALGSLAKEASLSEDAIRWTKETLRLLDGTAASDARRCSCLTRLASLVLRKADSNPLGADDSEILTHSLESLTGGLRSDAGGLDELLMDVSALRRAAIGYLSGANVESPDRELVETCKSLVFACLHFFIRYLGNPPGKGSDVKAITRFEQRRKFVLKTASSAIDSVLSILKTAVSTDEMCWETADGILQDCASLASRLDILSGLEQEEIGTTFLKISNIYWAYYLRKRQPSTNCFEAQLLRCLRRSVEVIRHRPQAEKEIGFLAVKLERLGGIYQSLGRLEEAKDSLVDAIQVHIDNGTLGAAAAAAAKSPFTKIWNDDNDVAILGRALAALVKIWLKGQESRTSPPFDDLLLPTEERATLLEWQLVVVARLLDTGNITILCSVVRAISATLIEIYGSDFPVRRSRLSLLLLCMSANHPGLFASSFADRLAEEAASINFDGGFGSDKALGRYQHYLKASISVCLAFRSEQLDAHDLKSAVSVWLGLVDSCDSWSAISEVIDGTDMFLSQLQATIDFFDMKGFGIYRIPALKLLAKVRELQEPIDPECLIKALSELGLQYLRLGYSGKAGLALAKAEGYLEKLGGSSQAKLQWHLAYAEYLVELGNIDKCGEYLVAAASTAEHDPDILKNIKPSATISGRVRVNRLIADASYVYSLLAFEKGNLNEALAHAKRGVKLNYRAWAGMETRENRRNYSPMVPGSDTELEVSIDRSTLAVPSTAVPPVMSTTYDSLKGSTFWSLVMPFYRGLFQLSSLYAHQGLFQEAIYYSEQGLKIASAVRATYLISHNLAVSGDQWVRSGNLQKGEELLTKAASLRAQLGKNKDDVDLRCWQGMLHGLQGKRKDEIAAYGDAQEVLETLMETSFINRLENYSNSGPECGLEVSMSNLNLKKSIGTREPLTRNGRQASTRTKKSAAPRNQTESVKHPNASGSECSQLLRLKGYLIRQKASTMILQNKCELAASLLSDARSLPVGHRDIAQQRLSDAKYLLLQAIDEMSADAVFCVLQDSTISFPSVANTPRPADKQLQDRSPGRQIRSTPHKLPSGGPPKAASKLKLSTAVDFVDILRQARDNILEVLAMAIQLCPTSTIHTISSVLSGVVMLLSAASPAKGKGSTHPHLATYAMEISKAISLQRQRGAIDVDSLAQDGLKWPTLDTHASTKDPSFPDVLQFQKEYIDVIPTTWTVISVSLSENKDELYISKLQAGLSPFIVRLPLCRHNSRDADEEVFNFSQGHAELCEIIDLANFSTRDARDMTRSGAKSEWWAEREALDDRLRDLLLNIENIWLGGFRGIFSQYPRHQELLSRFQSSFQKILDKHLPSRRKVGKRNKTSYLSLDPRILELFIGLGNPSRVKYDLDEPLTDLLYFVVDILQFHGERNAYDEIDFDAIAVETQDALRCYHETARAEAINNGANHTILILDKPLHVFPWESLPCLEGVSVSRMPSIACLRDRILTQRKDARPNKPEGFYIDRTNGVYVLNPAGDLKATQASFEDDLKTLENWDSIVQREPAEAEMKAALESHDLFLYFGHGSGAQYIRSRTVKKLEKCAVALLMGCSSGALTDAGEFEPYGTPINYAHAGCPALLATLWDVTDKDIDRFSHTLFNRWGLFHHSQPAPTPKIPKTPSRHHSKASKRREPVPLSFPPRSEPMSLVEAAAKSRDACILRYLNGAAPVVYGVPVYFA